MFCLLGSGTEQHFDVAKANSRRFNCANFVPEATGSNRGNRKDWN
jgi:hypothetical protein